MGKKRKTMKWEEDREYSVPTIGVCVFNNKDTSERRSRANGRRIGGKMPPPTRGREEERSRCRRSMQVEPCPIARRDKGCSNNNFYNVNSSFVQRRCTRWRETAL